MNRIDVGDRVWIWALFKDRLKQPANPSNITLIITKPNGVSSEHPKAELVSPVTGRWEFEYDVTMPGVHRYKFVGTGAIVAVTEGSFVVESPAVAA